MSNPDHPERIEYKGFRGTVQYSVEDRVYHGMIEFTESDLVLYVGGTLEALRKDFAKAVDEYVGLRASINMQEDN